MIGPAAALQRLAHAADQVERMTDAVNRGEAIDLLPLAVEIEVLCRDLSALPETDRPNALSRLAVLDQRLAGLADRLRPAALDPAAPVSSADDTASL